MTHFEYYIKGNKFEEGWRVFVETSYNKIGRALNQYNKWLLEEHEEPILDDVEKEYLSNIIKPFKDRVSTISKHASINSTGVDCYIEIRVKRVGNGYDFVSLPTFKPSTKMYKNMKIGHIYSLEELNL